MSDESYGLPGGYRANLGVRQGLGEYWDPGRITASARFQLAVYQAARRLARELGVRRVVDVGCGTAIKLNRLFDGFEIAGLDTAAAVKVARRLHTRGTYVEADLDDPELDLAAGLPPVQGRQLVICADVIEHLLHPERLLAAIHRFADLETRIVLSTPDRERVAGRHADRPSVPDHVREWTRAEFQRFVEDAGFVVLEQEVALPFGLGADWMTARYLVHQLRRRLPLRSNQLVVCRIRGTPGT